MKKLIKNMVVVVLPLLIIGLQFSLVLNSAYPVSAQGNPPPVGGNPPPVGGNPDYKLPNPLKFGTLCQLIDGLLTVIIEVGAIIAVIMFIWVGFKFVSAQGNEAGIKDAKRAFYTTVIGTAILLGSSAIAKIIFTTIMNITRGAGGSAEASAAC